MQKKPAKFITVEGIEGVGKSSCLSYILDCLAAHDIRPIQTREPGGTVIAEKIRNIMLAHHDEVMCNDTELLLAFAGRAQHLNTIIRPALSQGTWVLCDRFTDATFAYQGGGRGLDFARIESVKQWVHPDLEPDLTLLLYAPVNIALERAKGRGNLDRIEVEEEQFFKRVQDTYLKLAKQYPARYRLIDASQPPKLVKAQVEKALTQFLKND